MGKTNKQEMRGHYCRSCLPIKQGKDGLSAV